MLQKPLLRISSPICVSRPTALKAGTAHGPHICETQQHRRTQVISVTAGNGMLYARTRRGYTFAWGCGSQGQLGVGGSTKGNPLAQRMPGAHQITQITGARGGHFGAAVDTQGRVLTFGAGVPSHGLIKLGVGLDLCFSLTWFMGGVRSPRSRGPGGGTLELPWTPSAECSPSGQVCHRMA